MNRGRFGFSDVLFESLSMERDLSSVTDPVKVKLAGPPFSLIYCVTLCRYLHAFLQKKLAKEMPKEGCCRYRDR